MCSAVYIAIAFIAIHDKKGKEAYFYEDPTERTIQDAMRIRTSQPSWRIYTDDWGYFQRAYEENKNKSNPRYKNYNIYLLVCITAVCGGSLILIGSILESCKFFSRTKITSIFVFF